MLGRVAGCWVCWAVCRSFGRLGRSVACLLCGCRALASCLDDDELGFLGAPWEEYARAAGELGLDVLRYVIVMFLFLLSWRFCIIQSLTIHACIYPTDRPTTALPSTPTVQLTNHPINPPPTHPIPPLPPNTPLPPTPTHHPQNPHPRRPRPPLPRLARRPPHPSHRTLHPRGRARARAL